MSSPTMEAMNVLRATFQADPNYANGWHDNIACAAMDENISHETANKIAARFMFNAFGVSTGGHVALKAEDWPDTIG